MSPVFWQPTTNGEHLFLILFGSFAIVGMVAVTWVGLRWLWVHGSSGSRPPREIPPNFAEDRAKIARLEAWRAPGQSFTFLDRELVVASHAVPIPGPGGWRPLPRLRCHYVDHHGVIRQVEFDFHEIEPLIVAEVTA